MCFFCRTVAEVVSGVLQDFRPDLVLYDAGVDPHADDKLGRLKLTDNGLMRREMQVNQKKNRNSARERWCRFTCVHLAYSMQSTLNTNCWTTQREAFRMNDTYLTLGEEICPVSDCSKLLMSEWLSDDTCEAQISRAMALQVLDSVMAAGIPIAGNIGGGYHPDLTVLARRHCLLHLAAAQMFVDHKL